MRVHPITLALGYLRGRRTRRAAPFHGRPVFDSPEAAVATLRELTGQDFGTDAARWGEWLRANRQVYHTPRAKADGPAGGMLS